MPEGQCYRRNRRDILKIPEHSTPTISERYINDPRDMAQNIQTILRHRERMTLLCHKEIMTLLRHGEKMLGGVEG